MEGHNQIRTIQKDSAGKELSIISCSIVFKSSMPGPYKLYKHFPCGQTWRKCIALNHLVILLFPPQY